MAAGRGTGDQDIDRMAPFDAAQPRRWPEVRAAPPERSLAPYLEQQPSVFDLLSPGVLSLPTARHSRAAIVACQVKKTSSSCWSGSRRATGAAAAPRAVSGGQPGHEGRVSGGRFVCLRTACFCVVLHVLVHPCTASLRRPRPHPPRWAHDTGDGTRHYPLPGPFCMAHAVGEAVRLVPLSAGRLSIQPHCAWRYCQIRGRWVCDIYTLPQL